MDFFVISTLPSCIFGTTESSETLCTSFERSNQCLSGATSSRAWHHFYYWPRPLEKSRFTPINGQRCRDFPTGVYSYLPNKRACPFIYFRKKFHPGHARLFNFEKNSTLDMIFHGIKFFFHPPRWEESAILPVY